MAVGPTCTRPITTLNPGELGSNDDFCPTPPSLGLDDTDAGLLNSYNTYLAEDLLLRSTDDTQVFFRQVVAGFSLTPRDPIYSVCNCQRSVPNTGREGACGFFSQLAQCDNGTDNGVDGTCPVFSLFAADCPARGDRQLCNDTDGECYSVDATSADLVRVSHQPACGGL